MTISVLHTPENSGNFAAPPRESISSRLLINKDFTKFLLSQIVAQFASKSLAVILPLMAVITFAATPTQVGLLNAAQFFPVFVVTLFAGAWLDRRPRRPALIAAYAGNAILAATLPLATSVGLVHVYVLFFVAFGMGSLIAFSDVAYQAYIPNLVRGERLVQANSRLEVAFSLAMVGAPGLGGLLIGELGGSTAMVSAVVAYVLAAIGVLAIRAREKHVPAPARGGEGTLKRIAEGMKFTAKTPLLRVLTLQGAWFNLFEQAVLTLYLLYGIRVLDFSPQLVGLTMSLGAIGVLAGSAVARLIGDKLGVTRVLILGMGVASAAPVIIPFAAGSQAALIALTTSSFIIYGVGMTVFNIYGISLRQRATPDGMLARVSATYRFLAFGAIGVGGVVGGLAGDWFGLRPAMFFCIIALVAGWLVFARFLPGAVKQFEDSERAAEAGSAPRPA
ncbi:MFS transporter [Planobispora longispora]|uniref:MFS transporter n=1 Tax=Planobispora longispora TaxID=28887 RepID=A0A8J3RGA0_9ACTN|nr:MFS transporter [Planobispora longispora]GIH74438.1 MFS transporter [Planobispora longispora]